MRTEKFLKGKVKFLNKKKGFGSIACDDKVSILFFYSKNGNLELKKGDTTRFQVLETKKGIQAINIKKMES